ncbi:flippase [Methanobrevibacter sp.]
MSRVRTIFKNISWLMVSQIFVSVCGFIWTILTARYLGVSDYGVLGFAISFVSLIAFTMDFGVSSFTVRHIATDYDSAPKYLGNTILLKGIFCIGTIILSIIILILMRSNELTMTITLLFLIEGIFVTFITLMTGSFMAFEKGKYQAIGSIFVNSIILALILISIHSDLGIYGITLSYVIANIIGLFYNYFILNRYIAKPKYEFDKDFCKKLAVAGLPFAITGLLYTVYYSIDVVMLTNLVGSYATGVYNATYKLITVLTLFYTVYSAVIYPVMTKFFKNDKKLFIITYEKSIKYLMLIMIPLSVATTYYSLDIIQFVYGHEYDAAAQVLSILIWTVCLLFVNGAGNTLLNASYKEVSVTKIYGIAAVFNVVLNLILIPYLSFIGAAITTLLSDILIFIVQKYIIHKSGQKPDKRLYKDLGKIIAGSLVLGIALYYLKLNMWVALPVGIGIYLISVYLFKLFDDDDKYVIREILGRN